MLFPKIQRKSMLPMMWIQLPCMNIDATASTGQLGPGGLQVPLTSHGIQPDSTTALSRSGSSYRIHTAALIAISVTVTTGKRLVGMLSRMGIIRSKP